MSDRYRPPTGPKATRVPDNRKGPEKPPYNRANSTNNSKFKSFNQRDGNDRFPTGPKRDNYRPKSDHVPPAPRPPAGPSGRNDRHPNPKRPYNETRSQDSQPPNNKGFRGKPPYNKIDPKRAKFNPPKGPKPFEKRREPLKLTRDQIFSIRTTRASEIYRRVQQVGEGTYGKVYKAQNEVTQEFIALKKLRLETEREGFPITALREIKLLQSFDHPNIIGLLEMMVEQNQIYMVFDYMDHDLTGLLSHPGFKLEESHRKFLFKQLMEGIKYLHDRRVIHRDIKGSNILLDNIGRLKIGDFGLARTMKSVKPGESPDYTNRVITIWYRPPELLLGSTDYGREVDIWGVGCLLIELYSRMAIFQGFDEVSQLHKIFNIMGTPTQEEWPEIQNLPWFEMLKPKVNKVNSFADSYRDTMSADSFDLAVNLLHLNPHRRLTASEALKHDFFLKEPAPEPLHFLKDMKGEWHEFETKKRRRRERKRLQEEKEKQRAGNHEVMPESVAEVTTGGAESEPMTVNSTREGTVGLEEETGSVNEDSRI